MAGSRIEVEWGGALRRFSLPNAQLAALQDHLDLGPAELLRRLNDASAVFEGIRETVRQGLEGEGVAFGPAETLVRKKLDPALECWVLARAILSAWATSVTAALAETNVCGPSDDGTDGKEVDPTGRFNLETAWALAAAAGIQRSEFNRMDYAEVLHALDGWKRVHGAADGGEAPTDEEHEALKARFKDA